MSEWIVPLFFLGMLAVYFVSRFIDDRRKPKRDFVKEAEKEKKDLKTKAQEVIKEIEAESAKEREELDRIKAIEEEKKRLQALADFANRER